MNKYANLNNTIKSNSRPSSRQRHIWPAIIGAGVSIIGGMIKSGQMKKQQKQSELALRKQESDALQMSYLQQAQNDIERYKDFESVGQEGVQYYKKGGAIASKFANVQSYDQTSLANLNSRQNGGLQPNLPISNGGFQTKGGNLVPIGDGVEVAIGNRHNDTIIDGVSGIQLSENGNTVAEVENKEVIADGNVVYSDRMKYDGKRSFADMMINITKKRNKLEAKQDASNSKAEKNTIDRQLAGLNMAEETLFKEQERAKEEEGKQVLNNIFANGGRLIGRKPLPVPKWMETFTRKQQDGKYANYDRNALGDYRDPNDKRVIISENGMPKYPYEPTVVNNTPINPVDTTVPDASKNIMVNTIVDTMGNLASSIPDSNGYASIKAPPPPTIEPSTTKSKLSKNDNSDDSDGSDKKDNFLSKINWNTVTNTAGSIIPKIMDNIVNAKLTKNAPKLPDMLHAKAIPLETNVNINPQLAEIRRRANTMRRDILNNTSNSNNAKNNMVAASLADSRHVDELLAGKENQEMALRNADAQNRQAVTNANINQDNERSMMEFQRQNDLNTQRSQNFTNLMGDIRSTLTEMKLDNQFKMDTQANLMDDPMGTKAILYAKNKEFMRDKANRDFIFEKARTSGNKALVDYLTKNYNFQ